MSNKKKISKFFKKEAEKLPPEYYQAYHKYSTLQFHQDGDQAYPVYGEMEVHKVNHARRLKKLYKKHGKKAVDKYFNDRGFKLVPKDGQINNQVIREQQSGRLGDSKGAISK